MGCFCLASEALARARLVLFFFSSFFSISYSCLDVVVVLGLSCPLFAFCRGLVSMAFLWSSNAYGAENVGPDVCTPAVHVNPVTMLLVRDRLDYNAFVEHTNLSPPYHPGAAFFHGIEVATYA